MPNYYNQTIESVLKELKSGHKGLSQAEAERRLKKYGHNRLKEEKSLGKLTILLEQFKSPLIYILLIAGYISFLLQEYIDMGVILGAVILNTVIGFFQENKASQALAKLKKMVEHKTVVWRDGQEKQIDSGELAVGDVVALMPGSRVPADGRLLEASGLEINEASLTGESAPAKKTIEPVSKGASLPDRSNMIYAGTVVAQGTAKAIVTAIGENTEIGQIAKMVKTTKEEKTPLQIRLAGLSKFLGIVIGIISLLVVGIGIWQGRDFFEMFIVGVAIAVAAIPEGLVVAVTVILVLGMQYILKEKALVRKLMAAETLGSITVICTDKTGTLTEGKMSVAHIVIGEKEFEIKTLGSRQDEKEAKNVSLAMQIGMMCNSAVIENPKDVLDEWRIIGAPTETALLLAAYQSGLDKGELLKIEPKVDEMPFSSETKFMITLHKKKHEEYVLYEKGAPEKLLEKSSNFYHLGKLRKLTGSEKEKLSKTYENLTNKGLRVIGVAFKNLKITDWDIDKKEKDWSLVDKDLNFVGFIALKDPLRPEAGDTIKICRQAGIRPIIVTGDHRLTAEAIAMEIGFEIKKDNVITGETLDKTDDKRLKELVKKIDIYARVSPHHKLRIIKALQSRGEVVAMTGDGINDSPALKAADIGLGLGTGTDISKETSDIILLDNNFKTIVSAIRQGRIIFANIRKVITYLISDSFSEVILIVGSIILGMPLAVLPTQILWINIVNDGLPDFSLAFEKGDKGVMREKPIKRNEPIMNTEMKTIIFGVGIARDLLILGLFSWLFYLGTEINYLRTVLFAILGFKSLISIFSLRSLRQPIWRLNPVSNIYLVIAVGISFVLLFGAIYWHPLQIILSTVSLSLGSWLLVASIGVLNITMIEGVKMYFARKES